MPTAEHVDRDQLAISAGEAILRELHTISLLLDRSGEVQDFTPSALVVTDDSRALREQRDWPIDGGRRWIVGRQGYGQTLVLQAGVPLPLVPADAARLGGLISVPAGATAVTLYLTRLEVVQAANEAVPQIALGPGNQWDFKLGDVLWGGAVTALAAAGSSVAVGTV